MRTSRTFPVLSFLFLLGVFYLTPVICAQSNDYLNRVNRPNFAVMEPVENGFINLANGSMHLDIPMAKVSQRGGKQLTVSLTYDSRIYNSNYGHWFPNNVHPTLSGWKVVLAGAADAVLSGPAVMPAVNTGVSYSFSQTQCNVGAPNPGNVQIFSHWTWESAEGTSKSFSGLTTSTADDVGGDCSFYEQHSGSAGADDGSGFTMVVTNDTEAVVYDAAGNQVYPTVEDTNGNLTDYDGNGNVIDQLSRTPVLKTENGNVTYYDILNSEGTRSRFAVTYTTINVNTAFGRPYTVEYNGTLTVVQSLTLPNGTSYSFGYDSGTAPGSYGLLTSMTLPTGGQIQYGYTNFADSIDELSNPNRWLTSRNSVGNLWTYTPQVTGSGNQQVTVTQPNGESAVYSFVVIGEADGAWNTTTVYRDASGNTVKTELKDYIPPVSTGSPARFLSRLTTAIPAVQGNLTKKIEYSYDNVGNVSEVREWDY